jgi:hypothetical protein
MASKPNDDFVARAQKLAGKNDLKDPKMVKIKKLDFPKK